jgi:DNA-binding PadR family transcriptional regulator
MSLSTLKENGYIEVAKERENPPVKIYYELHGDGPQHVVLIMGNFLLFMRIILN